MWLLNQKPHVDSTPIYLELTIGDAIATFSLQVMDMTDERVLLWLPVI